MICRNRVRLVSRQSVWGVGLLLGFALVPDAAERTSAEQMPATDQGMPTQETQVPNWRALANKVRREESGRIVVIPAPVEDRFKNPWPAGWEDEFRVRADLILKAQAARVIKNVNTFFENEKRTYGFLMAQVLAGDSAHALKLLQQEDVQAQTWHQHTAGIDYFACFTLKHQMRKYFYFGDLLQPVYRQRMFEGAKAWTERDPLKRPHPAFQGKKTGYGPDAVNSWVDARNTENLFLMRETSVYLMAEETGNESTRVKYKNRLLTYVKSLYRIGMGEWDSENYHGHSISPLLNLYDFARDAEVKMAAKLALDFLMTAGAIKYYRGAFNGPSKRDYNHPQPFGGSAACMLWVYFGDTPVPNAHWESDEVHCLTSSYRPPAAVVNLARKRFDKPAELWAAKPRYGAPQQGQVQAPPEQLETHYFGHTFQLGSLVGGTQEPDINGFKAVVFDSKRGAVAVQGVPGSDPHYVGSPQYQSGKLAGPNRIAQNRNIVIWLVQNGNSPWVWVIPETIQTETVRGVTFLRAEKTWFALHPLNLSVIQPSDELTNKLRGGPGKGLSRWEGHLVLTALGKGGKFCGIALEVGEAETHRNYAEFQNKVLTRAQVDASDLERGIAAYTASDGRSVKLVFGTTPSDTQVWRDGRLHDLSQHARYVYRDPNAQTEGLVFLEWGGGTLRVHAGGAQFIGTVDAAGRASFINRFSPR